jgi:hypothetical protein
MKRIYLFIKSLSALMFLSTGLLLIGCSKGGSTRDSSASSAEITFFIRLSNEGCAQSGLLGVDFPEDGEELIILSGITLLGRSDKRIPVFSGEQPLSVSPIEFDAIVEPASTDSLSISISLVSNGVPGTLTGNLPSDVWEPGYRYVYSIIIGNDGISFGSVNRNDWGDPIDIGHVTI